MAVTCPACGEVSRDEEFCDRCNAELAGRSFRPPSVCRLDTLGDIELTTEEREVLSWPEASVTVVPKSWADCQSALPLAWRIHWIAAELWPRWQAGLEGRMSRQAVCLPFCRVVAEEQGCWILAEAAAERSQPWLAADGLEAPGRLRLLTDFLDDFQEALTALHAAGLVWLTFDPREMETYQGRLRFTNMDLGVYPARQSPGQLNVVSAFAAPEVVRFRAEEITERTDVFHLALFSYYWLARYLPSGFLGEGLEAFDFALPPLRIFAPDLPPGIASVLARGLEGEPARRYGSVSELCAALRSALHDAESRARSAVPVRWEVGIHTRTGRSKTERGEQNEDAVLLKEIAEPARALVAVADGISSCDVGSGAIASRTVCEALDAAFAQDREVKDFGEAMAVVCCRAGGLLLDWALRQGERTRLLRGHHLMGTTLTAGWLEGNRLTLANLGDSRAYLVHTRGIEQLTVDGDLGCSLLRAGAPPEEVQDLGSQARALRECVGGCYRTPWGELAVDEDRCRPSITHWTLLPGDVVVLCTDGLVEEGQFLDPEELAGLVRDHQDLPAAVLAEKLAEGADARQRLPSAEEPEGRGDNISCAVIKVGPG
jgi:serine/threonine protein phosphatase PrpC